MDTFGLYPHSTLRLEMYFLHPEIHLKNIFWNMKVEIKHIYDFKNILLTVIAYLKYILPIFYIYIYIYIYFFFFFFFTVWATKGFVISQC